MIETPRLRLLPATLASVRAEIADRASFSRELGAEVPDNWPPGILKDALVWFLSEMEAHPEDSGWYGWYAVLTEDATGRPVLVGSVGFKGPPDGKGIVEIGYSVLPQFQRKGIASEMVAALLNWAFLDETVSCVMAETTPDNLPSVRILERLGFDRAGAGTEPGGILFKKARTEHSPRR